MDKIIKYTGLTQEEIESPSADVGMSAVCIF